MNYQMIDVNFFQIDTKGKVQGKNGDVKYYCKKSECKKTGGLEGPDDSFMVNCVLR